MQWNSQTDSEDLVSDCKFWCGIASTDSTSYPLDDMSRVANKTLDRVHMLIITADGNWKYNDVNNAAEVISTSTTVTSGANKKVLNAAWLKVARVRMTDSQGNYVTLRPVTRRQWSDARLNASSGMPSEYSLLGNYMYFNCAVDHDATLEVEFQTGASHVDGDTDTTWTPGFASGFHQIVSLEMALEYCEINDLDNRAAKVRNRLGEPPTEGNLGKGLYKQLVDYYATRNLDDRPAVKTQREDYGEAAMMD